MIGFKIGFQNRIKECARQAKGIHCIIHRFDFANMILVALQQEAFDSMINIVNYMQSGALNSRLFKNLHKDMKY